MKRVRLFPLVVVAAAIALYLAKVWRPDTPFFTQLLTTRRLLAVSGIAKLACLATGALYGARGVRRLAPTNPVRRAWVNLTIWIALWTVAQAGLFVYPFLLGTMIPVLSPSDVGFLAGYPFLFAAQLQFVATYRRSGFPVGSAREHLAMAGVASVVVLGISYVTLAPIARSELPLAERAILIAYPALDLAASVPALVLLRIALAFRPGKVWTVWAWLSAAFLFFAVGDFITTLLWPDAATLFDPVIHLTYFIGYFSVGWGMKLQHELLTE